MDNLSADRVLDVRAQESPDVCRPNLKSASEEAINQWCCPILCILFHHRLILDALFLPTALLKIQSLNK